MSAPPINRPMWAVARVLLPVAFRVLFRLRREGAENIPASGAVLFVANHASNLDPPLIGAGVLPRKLHFMAKKELFSNRVAAAVIGGLGAFPVDRGGADRAAFRTAREVLAEGGCLLMFPEGTRSADGTLGAAWPGAGSLGLEDGVTVIPVAITGSRSRRGPVTVRLGTPLDLGDVAGGARSARSQAAADRMMEAISAMLADMTAREGAR